MEITFSKSVSVDQNLSSLPIEERFAILDEIIGNMQPVTWKRYVMEHAKTKDFILKETEILMGDKSSAEISEEDQRSIYEALLVANDKMRLPHESGALKLLVRLNHKFGARQNVNVTEQRL